MAMTELVGRVVRWFAQNRRFAIRYTGYLIDEGLETRQALCGDILLRVLVSNLRLW